MAMSKSSGTARVPRVPSDHRDGVNRGYGSLLPAIALALVCTGLGGNPPALGQVPKCEASAEIPACKAPEELRRRGEELINGMVSRNRPPAIDDWHIHFPEDFDWTEGNRVLRAVRQAVDEVEELWPVLVEHLEDPRYCVSCRIEDISYNFTVGKICRYIISNALSEAYYPCRPKVKKWWIVSNRLSMPEVARGDGKALKAWCKQRSDKKLYELQIEMCQWAISTVAELDGVSEEDKSKSIEAIRAKIAALRESKQPVKPKSIIARVAKMSWYFYQAPEIPVAGDSEDVDDAARTAPENAEGTGMF